MDWAFFAEKTKEWEKKAPIQVSPYPLSDSLPERNKSIAETLRRLLSENSCDGELFPVESIMKKRCLEKEKAVCHEKTIAEAKKALLEDILESFFGEKA